MLRPLPISFAHSRQNLIVASIALAGAVERGVWNLLRPGSGGEGEALNVALSISRGLGLADAYGAGQGPTAHQLPISPSIAGAVYAIFGAPSVLAEIVLACWSIGLSIGTYLLLYRVFGRMGVGDRLRTAGLALGCLAPTYISQEAVDFRVWEGGLAAFLAALFLDRLFHVRAVIASDVQLGVRSCAILGGSVGVLFFVNPPLGVAGVACLGLLALKAFSFRQMVVTGVSAFTVFVCTVGPWTLRNLDQLGAPVLLRSNAGLELALTNYPEGALRNDECGEFLRRLAEIHPTVSRKAFDEMTTVGEVAYFNRLGGEAVQWITSNPASALSLWLHHMHEMLVPSAWKFTAYRPSRIGEVKAMLARLFGIGGLLGLAALLLRRRGSGAVYPAVIIAVTTVLISPFQPVVRYTYLIYPLMVYFTACAPLLFIRRAAARPAA